MAQELVDRKRSRSKTKSSAGRQRRRFRPIQPAPHRTAKTIDHVFQSLSLDQNGRAIGVILSGTSMDGVQGLKAIKAEGGITIAQDEKSAKYYDLPRSAVAAGFVDLVLAPKEIAQELAKISEHPYF